MDLRVDENGIGIIARASEWLVSWRRRLATLAVLLLVIPLGIHAIYGSNGWISYGKKKAEYRQLQQELRELQAHNESLERRVQALREADPRVIEREAREQLRYAKPGEVVLVMPEERQRQDPGMARSNEKP